MPVLIEFLFVIALAIGVGTAAYVALVRVRGTRREMRVEFDADRVLLALVLAYVVIFTALAILRYLTFHAGYLGVRTAWDLGQYGQLLWNSLNGRLLQGTFVRDADSFLGKSFTPILLAFVPLYAVWANPIVLLLVQTIGLGVSALPIYWFARERLGRGLALVVSLAYLLSPALENIGLTEFHEIALAPPLLAYATFFLLRRHHKGFLVCLGLALLVKEEIALIAIMFGIYIFFFQRRRGLGLAVAAFGAIWIVLLLQYLIPYFRGAAYGGTFYYFGEGVIGGGGTRYGYLGRSIPEILTTIFTKPGFVLQHVLIPEKIEYVLHLLTPLMFLPLIGFEVLTLTLPTFGYSLLSTYGLQYSIRSYYFAPLLPFLFFATVIALQRLLDWGRQWRLNRAAWHGALSAGLLTASGVTYLLQAPGPFARHYQSWRYNLDAHARLGNELVSTIPSDAVVVGQNEFLAHLSNRRFLYEIPVIPDYRQTDYFFADTTPDSWYYVHEGFWERYLTNGYFEIVTQADGYLIGRRKTPDHPRAIRFGDSLTFLGHSLMLTDTLRGGMAIRPVVLWRADQPLAERYQIAVRLVDAQGHLWAEEDREPLERLAPTDEWKPGKLVGDQYTLNLPVTMPSGDYRLTLTVHPHRGEELPARDEQGNALGAQPAIATIHVEKNKQSFLASDLWWLEQRLYVDMREMRFLGYVPPPREMARGEVLPVGVYWRARGKPQGDYFVAVQLRDAAGRVAFEHASRPANGTYPTTAWDAGEVLLDWHDLALPRELAEGEYRIVVLLREANTNQLLGETPVATVTVR